MTLRMTGGDTMVKTTDGAMYSSGEQNFFAAFGKNITTCEMGTQQDSRGKPDNSDGIDKEGLTNATPLPCIEADDANSNHSKRIISDGPKVNFQMLTINGIRVLLAKAVAFDILVTVKAMFF